MTPFTDRPIDSTIFERNWPTFAIVGIAVVGVLAVCVVPDDRATTVIKFLGPVLALLALAYRQKSTHDLVASHSVQLDQIHAATNNTAAVAVVEAKAQNQLIGGLHQEVKALRQDVLEKQAK